jgi:tRNA pseudouridine55 synthase
MKGFFLFSKPAGISSAYFLNQIKKQLGEKKIGHGGTLDPIASGLLVVAISREYTKKLSQLLNKTNKTYLAEIILGQSSDTYDTTGIITNNMQQLTSNIKKEDIENAIEKIKSSETQIPPKFSAIKIKGKPAYARAARGEEFEIRPKEVSLLNYEIIDVKKENDNIILKINLEVSSGFYVRSFANDLGEILGTGGIMSGLTRTNIGDFDLKEAFDLKDLDDEIELYFRVSGAVQSVGYRYFALKNAQNWSIKGFVSNIGESSVELVGQGKLTDLERFLDVLKTGPESAKIDKEFSYFRKVNKKYNVFEVLE